MFPSRLVMQINFVCIQHVQSGENMAAMGVYTFIASKSIYATQVGLQLLFSPLGSDIVMRTACCSVGVVLPVYSTLKPIETKDQDEQHKWLIYGLNPYLSDPLTSASKGQKSGNGMVSKFPVDHEINSKIYLWRGNPWNLELDAVVNSTNENLDEAHSSPGLHAAAGPGLAEECATRGGCRTGMTKVTHAYLQEGHTYCKA